MQAGPRGPDHGQAGGRRRRRRPGLARDMAKRVEQELQYPGQIKITVVREIRSIEYAEVSGTIRAH